jgi:protein XagA
MKRLAVAILTALGAATSIAPSARPALAGAWTQQAGHGQALAVVTHSKSSHEFDDDGDLVGRPRYDKTEAGLLIEYGVTDWLTLMLQPQLLIVDIAPPVNADSSGPGYTDIGARARLWSDEDEVFSVQALGRAPGKHDESNPAEIGNTDAELDIRALYGHSFKVEDHDAFIDAQFAYRVRFDDPPSEVRFDFTFGIRARPDLLLLAQSFNTFADGSGQGIFEDGREHKIQLSAVWDLDKVWSLQLGGIATVAGENTLAQRGIVAGIWAKF